jgi:sec-independent protein translocase protein TatC
VTATEPREQDVPADAQRYVGEEMTLVEHLEELRSRMFKAAVAVVLGFVVGFVLRNQVLEILSRPYCELPAQLREVSSRVGDEACALIFTDVLGAFFISLKAAAIVTVLLAGPAVCYQLWRFITPGLRPVERQYAVPFLVFSQLLFVAGGVFSYFLIPRALQFLLGFAGPNIVSLMDANRYLGFVLQTMIAFGVAFEFPLILIVLALMGVVTSAALRKYRRHALFGTFVAAAIITPTQDPATMSMMAAPLVAFYEISVVAARLIERRRRRAAAV